MLVGFTRRNNYIYGAGIYHTLNKDDSFSFSLNGHLKEDPFDFITKTNYQILNDLSEIETTRRTIGNGDFVNIFAN
jgi:hypothetical protein